MIKLFADNLLLFPVLQMISRDIKEDPAGGKQPGETNVSVQLFDSPPMNFTVSGDIPWTDPKFSEVVAQAALDQYKESSVWVSSRATAGEILEIITKV